MADDDDATPGDPDGAPGALDRGRQLEAAGHLTAARSAYESAMKSGTKRESALASLAIAEMLNRQGDVTHAERAYQSAVESGIPDVTPIAAFGLGMLREISGDIDGAITAFRITMASGHQRFAADAANQIGDLLLKQKNHTGARAAYQKAVESGGDPVAAARGRLRIAQLDYREGNRETAKAVMQTLGRSAPKAVALAALFSLGQLLAREGKIDDARRALNEVRQSGEPIWVDKANRELRKLQPH